MRQPSLASSASGGDHVHESNHTVPVYVQYVPPPLLVPTDPHDHCAIAPGLLKIMHPFRRIESGPSRQPLTDGVPQIVFRQQKRATPLK